MRFIAPHKITRRHMVMGLASLAASLAGVPLHANSIDPSEIDQPAEGLPPLDAVLILHDDSVDARDLRRQRARFHQRGTATRAIKVVGDLDKDRFLDLMHQCEAILAEERHVRPQATIAVMAWCDVANPLRELPDATSADIAIAHLMLWALNPSDDLEKVPRFVLEGRSEVVFFLIDPHQFKDANGIQQDGAGDRQRAGQRFHLFVTIPADNESTAMPLVPSEPIVRG